MTSLAPPVNSKVAVVFAVIDKEDDTKRDPTTSNALAEEIVRSRSMATEEMLVILSYLSCCVVVVLVVGSLRVNCQACTGRCLRELAGIQWNFLASLGMKKDPNPLQADSQD